MGKWNSKLKSINTSFFVLHFSLIFILQCFLLVKKQEVSLVLVTGAEDVRNMALNYLVGYLQVKVPEARVAMGRISHVG